MYYYIFKRSENFILISSNYNHKYQQIIYVIEIFVLIGMLLIYKQYFKLLYVMYISQKNIKFALFSY